MRVVVGFQCRARRNFYKIKLFAFSRGAIREGGVLPETTWQSRAIKRVLIFACVHVLGRNIC